MTIDCSGRDDNLPLACNCPGVGSSASEAVDFTWPTLACLTPGQLAAVLSAALVVFLAAWGFRMFRMS